MSLSRQVLDTLIDLVEIKMSCMECFDRDDQRELANLEKCRDQLLALAGEQAQPQGAVVEFQSAQRAAV